jgi:hypothetical protein
LVTAVTSPLETDATPVFELVHVTALLEAPEGTTVAVSCAVPAGRSDRLEADKVTPVTAVVTVTVTDATNEPLTVVAVMVAVPFETPRIRPLADTVATPVADEFHVIFLFEAFAGVMVATS